uniref:Nuclear pore complex protein Nup214 n=1 Tax=Panagrolaimus superbus TaxID=310955 RepID=A0A914ZCK5_9BILA
METIQDLQLRQIRKFRAFPPQNLASTEFGRKLVGISSRYGFAVIIGPDNRLISVKTTDLQALQADDFKELNTFPKRDMDFFNLQAEIFSVEFNSDGRVLAVAANTQNGAFVYIFDGFTFYPSYPQQPFPLQSVRLTSNSSAKLTAFEWNPCIPEMFATSTTDGLSTIQYTLNNPKSYSILGNQVLKSAVTCISWSPKGKQLTVGDADGKVHQLKPELAPVRTIDAPPSLPGLGNPPYRCVGICWLSTTEWAVVHSSATNYLNLSLLTGKKNQAPTWDSWSGVLPPLSDPSVPRSVNFLPLFDWQFVLATSTCLTNAVTFGSNGIVWKPWELPEPFVINTPLSTSHKDTFIVGSGFDFTSTKPVVIERDGTEAPPQPIIYTLTSDGILLLYHVTSLNPARPSLIKPIEPCDLNATKNGDQPMGFQPRPTTTTPSQPATVSTPIRQAPTSLFGTPPAQAPTSLFGTPSTPNIFSSLARTESPSTPTTTMQNTVTSNTAAAAEEEEKQKKEAELKAQAEEQERQKRFAAEEEQKRKAAAEAEAQKQQAEEEAKRKQQTAELEANFKANLDGLVSKLNEYSKSVEALRAFKMKLMQNTKLNVEFDAHIEPMLKSIGYVSIIGNDIDESLTRLRQVSNSIQRSAKESQQFLLKDSKELPTPEWVLELSDDLDELEQREFIVVEKLQQAEEKMEKISKLLKEGKAKFVPRNQLTPEQQQKLEKDSKTMLIFVRKLWERIKILRHQLRDINFDEKIMQAKQAIRSAGGEQNVSILNESDANFDTSDNNASMLASELIASISLVDKTNGGTSEPVKNNVQNLLKHLDQASSRPPKLVNVVPIDQFVSTQKLKETAPNSTILKPKVAEAHKNLIEHLMKVQSPRAITQNIPAAPPRQPLTLFDNRAAAPQPTTVSTPQQQKSLFGTGNISVVTPTSAAPTSTSSPFGSLSTFGQQPKTSTPKPLFSSNTAFTPQQSASPLFGTSLTSSPLATTTTTPKIDAEEQKRKEAEEEQKKKDAAEVEAKKKAQEEAEKIKKEADEKAKKEAEEQERLKKLEEEKQKAEAEARAKAEEEEKKKKAAELEAQKQAAAEEEAKKKQESTAPPSNAAPLTFSFKPAAAALPSVVSAVAPTTAVNFSFKPQATATTTPVKSESNADIGMEDDGLDSALAGTNICSPTNTGNAFGSGTSGGGFSSFGGNAFGQQPATTPVLNNPFGGFSSTPTTAPANGSPFGGTSAFGATVKNPFGGGTTNNTGFSS